MSASCAAPYYLDAKSAQTTLIATHVLTQTTLMIPCNLYANVK